MGGGLHGLVGAPESQRLDRLTAVVRELEAAAGRDVTLVRLADLAWRRSSLRAVEEAGLTDRATRLQLLADVQDGGAARDALIGFWRRTMVAPVSEAMFTAFVTMAVPEPCGRPDPAASGRVRPARRVGLAAPPRTGCGTCSPAAAGTADKVECRRYRRSTSQATPPCRQAG